MRKYINPTLEIAGFVPTLFTNANQDKMILHALQEQLSSLGRVYPPIPRATAFADAAMSQEPLAIYQPRHPAIEIINQIAEGMEHL